MRRFAWVAISRAQTNMLAIETSLDEHEAAHDTWVDAVETSVSPSGKPPPTFVGGRYRIEDELGRGGVGAVYRATCLHTGNHVAVKLLHEQWHRDPRARYRFLREAEATRSVQHRNVVRVLDTGVDLDGTAWFAQELLQGWDLRTVLRQRPLSPTEARDVAEQLLSALVAVHAQGWIHRDIKPENIFLHAPESQEAVVKLLDFGIAIPMSSHEDAEAPFRGTGWLSGQSHARRPSAEITSNGTVLGTPAYMAPERARNAPLGPQTDLWSVGAVLFEALSGRPPFEGRADVSLLAKISKEPPPSVADLCELPLALAELIDRALRTAPEQRYRSAAQMLAALTEHASDITELDW